MRTGITLFLGDGACSEEEEKNIAVNRLGGNPYWLQYDSSKHPDLKCQLCNSFMFLLSQLNCSTDSERMILIFGCNTRKCLVEDSSKSMKVIRQKKLRDIPAKKHEEKKEIDWAKEFEMLNIDTEITFESQDNETESKVNKKANKKVNKKVSFYDQEYPVQFPSIYLVEDDELINEKDKLFQYAKDLYMKYKSECNDELETTHSVEAKSGDKEVYEKDERLDKAFEKFEFIVSNNAKQCIRYKRNGDPLSFAKKSSPKNIAVPKCSYCQSERVHELQLMPYLHYHLPFDSDEYLFHLDNPKRKNIIECLGIEFGTIHIYTCANDCDSEVYAEEFCHVEIEE